MIDECKNCLHFYCDENEMPCRECKHNYAYENVKERFESRNIEHPYADVTDKCITANTKPDNVEHPNHYKSESIECIDAMVETQGVEATKAFCVCNAFKYIWRHDKKNGIEDIKKAVWYLNKFLELCK